MSEDIKKKHTKARKNLLAAINELLLEHNWSEELLLSAEKQCKKTDKSFIRYYSKVLYPGGMLDIIEDFEKGQDLKMLEILNQSNEKNQSQLKIREKISKALEIRIMSLMSKEAFIKHNSYLILPCNGLFAGKLAFTSCDHIWRFAGDKSTDYNYYSKRVLLQSVYLSAKLFYISDDSEEYQKTKEFIATSLKNIINIASLKNKIKLPSVEDIPFFRMFS